MSLESHSFVRAKLVNYTNSDCSEEEAKNSRWHYYLKFEESIGWDWLYSQIQKLDRELEVGLELWEIHPSGVSSFEVEVRELDRREGIDENQSGLTDFE